MNNSNGSFFGGDWLGAFLIIAVLFNGGNFFGAGNGGMQAVNDAVNNQSVQNGIRDVLLSSANNNYETARLISDQNMIMMNQNNSNLVNAIQGFNQVTGAINGQGSQILQAISQLGYQMDACCCSIKTQMLQDKYDALENLYRTAQNDISNANQTQTLLNALGRFIAYPPMTTTAATTAAS